MRLFNRTPVPQGAAAGVAVGLPELGAGIPSALEQLLSKGRGRATLAMLGPAFVASVAYVDPGNFATNFAGGAQFGYLLLWVVLVANLIAMLIPRVGMPMLPCRQAGPHGQECPRYYASGSDSAGSAPCSASGCIQRLRSGDRAKQIRAEITEATAILP